MKAIKNFIEESKHSCSIDLKFDDFNNDLYNALVEIMFEYNQQGKNINKKSFDEAIKFFNDKFFE